MSKMYQQVYTIPKGKQSGTPIYTDGHLLRFIGFPTRQNGSVSLRGDLSFEGSFDGKDYFTVNDYNGQPVTLPSQATQNVITPPDYLPTAPAFVPVQTPKLFDGILMLRPVSSLAQTDDQKITLIMGGE